MGLFDLLGLRLRTLELSLAVYRIEELRALGDLRPLALVLNGAGRIVDVARWTVAQILGRAPPDGGEEDEKGLLLQARAALEVLEQRHDVSLVGV